MPYSRIREAPESSSAATLRAVVAALNDAWHAPQSSTPAQKRLARFSRHLPRWMVQRKIANVVRQRALAPDLARYVKTQGLARQVIAHYQQIEGRVGYPVIIIGPPNGALAYLAALLDAAFLPSHFLLSFADRTQPDAIETYQQHGAHLIKTILQTNHDLQAVNHYDPIHDRFLVSEVNHVRLKLLKLPEAYQQFIKNHLAKGSTLLFAENSYSWSQYKIGERHNFQVGGLGGFLPQEYLRGTEALDAWLDEQGSAHRGGWLLTDYELENAPESEWGSLPQFQEQVKRFAHDHDYQFRAIRGAHPEDYSSLTYTAYLWESRLHDRTPNGLLVECFTQINPTAALRADLLPLWMPFNTVDSLESFRRMLPYLPKALPVGLSLLPNFTQTPDMPSASQWADVAQRIGPLHWLGVQPEHYPMDAAAFINYVPDLKQWVQENPGRKPRPQLTPEAFLGMIDDLNRHGSRLFAYLLNDKEEKEQNGSTLHEPGPIDEI
jgi:hypothetical protein